MASASNSGLIAPYLAPTQLPLWQVAAALNALLAWGLYLFADKHLEAIEIGNPNRVSEGSIKGKIATVTAVRNSLTLYTIACTLYITWKIAAEIEWPAVELVLFPWSR